MFCARLELEKNLVVGISYWKHFTLENLVVELDQSAEEKGSNLSIITWKIAKMDHLWLVNSHILPRRKLKEKFAHSSNIIKVFFSTINFL